MNNTQNRVNIKYLNLNKFINNNLSFLNKENIIDYEKLNYTESEENEDDEDSFYI